MFYCRGRTPFVAPYGKRLTPEAGFGSLQNTFEIGQSLTSITDLHQLLNKIAEAVTGNMNAQHVLIILRHPVSAELRIEYSNVNIDTNTQKHALQFSKTVVNDVVNKGKSILSRDVVRDETLKKTDSVMTLQIRSLMCVPLTSRQNSEIIGTLYADNRSAKNVFKQDDIQLLESFANMAAIAIENAHLYDRLKWAKDYHFRELT